jgi:hypothetical protein
MIEGLLILGASALGIGAVLYDPVVGLYREHQEQQRADAEAADAAHRASIQARLHTLYEARSDPRLSITAQDALDLEIDRWEFAQREAEARLLLPPPG